MNKKLKIALIAVASVLATIILSFTIYINITYKPDDYAKHVYKENGNSLTFGAEYYDNEIGFIIYPGGKVEPEAYAPLAKEISELGYLTVIAEFTFNLGIIDTKAADDIIKKYSEIDEWIIVGHSLGGTAASIYADSNDDKINSVVFLGSYAYKNLSDNDLKTITITGSNDLVLDRDGFNNCLDNYPENNIHLTIDGGNHAYFGSYGEQKGDGTASITSAEQRLETVNAISTYILT